MEKVSQVLNIFKKGKFPKKLVCFLLFLFSDSGLRVGQLDIEFGGSFDEDGSLSPRNVMSNGPSISSVVHQQDLQISGIGNQEPLEAVLGGVSGISVVSVANLNQRLVAFELPSHSVVDTVGLSPAGSQLVRVVLALEASESLRPFLLNPLSVDSDNH